MSSLNQAFIKAYGREAAAAAEPAAEPATPAPAPVVIDNWYAADAWYRAEAPVTAAAAPVAPPHLPAPAYQPPTSHDLSELLARVLTTPSEDAEYRLSPPAAVVKPEIVVDEEAALPIATLPPPAPAVVVTNTPLPPAPAATTTVLFPAAALEQLFTPMQVMTGWESTLGVLPALTTASPVPVVAPPKSVGEAKVAGGESLPRSEAPQTNSPPAKSPVVTPRLDAAASAPVPKPHTTFTTPPVEAAPVAKSPPPAPVKAEAPVAKVEAPVAKVEAPAPAPLGLLQPAWEVDRFQIPEQCRKLLATENDYLADVGARLSNAARDGLSILAITSTRRGEGRTTLALCLARAAAAAGVKVALVDADIENPQLVNDLGVEATCGWHDVVTGDQPLAEAAIVSLEDRFAFFPWTSSTQLKSLNDPRATRVLREIAKAYSLVILDLGPVPGRETRLFEDGDHCPVDAAILVRDVRWTSSLEAQRVAAQLTAAGVASVGIAENFGPRVQQAA